MGLIHKKKIQSKEGVSEKSPGVEPGDFGKAHIGVKTSSIIYKQCGQKQVAHL